KVARVRHFVEIHAHVVAGRTAGEDEKAQRVGGVFGDDIERVVAGAKVGFGHFGSVGVAHDAVQIHGVKRNLTHELDAEHNHAGDPEEQNVVTRFQYGGWIEIAEVLGVVGPAERGKGPQA